MLDRFVDAAGCLIREIEATDHEETLEIAASSCRYSRFRLDPLISPTIANRIKRDWILNYIRRQRGERLFVALMNGRLVGFLAVNGIETNGQRSFTIDLIGVSWAFQKQGIGKVLTAFFVKNY